MLGQLEILINDQKQIQGKNNKNKYKNNYKHWLITKIRKSRKKTLKTNVIITKNISWTSKMIDLRENNKSKWKGN